MNAPRQIDTANQTVDYNPATGKETGRVDNTDMSQIPQMFVKAKAAQAQWAALSFKQRAVEIQKMKTYIISHVDELAQTVSSSNGKTRVDALATEVLPCSLACDWYAKNAEKVLKEKRVQSGSILFINKRSAIQRKPRGVVGVISPWNYPLSIPFGEIIMGLMAGNAIILKVAAATPSVGEAIGKIIAAGNLPDGLFQQIVGSGGAVSKAFFDNDIDKIFFTGSVPVGKQLMVQAAEKLTPLSLELGGNDPMIVLEDADLERATNGAAWAGYQNGGQSCGGVERVYVHESIFDDFVSLLAAKTKALRHGNGSEGFNVDVGAITTQGQLNTIKQHLEDAVNAGATIVAQSQPVGDQNGFFHPATLLTNVNEEMLTLREETFGPIIPVQKFKTEEEAIQMANASDLALTSSVWTKDNARGRHVASQLESGVTTINDHLYTHGLSEMPWGGWKLSGTGRTHGAEGLLEMTHTKAINWDLLPVKRNLWWYPFDEAAYKGLKNAIRFANPESLGDLTKSAASLTPFALRKMFSKWKFK